MHLQEVYYHLYIGNPDWELWLDEQLQCMIASGVLNNSKLYICTQYKNKIISPDKIESIINTKYPNIEADISVTINNFKYEGSTLYKLYERAVEANNNIKMLYIHSKGASRILADRDAFPDRGRHDWRQMMNYFCF